MTPLNYINLQGSGRQIPEDVWMTNPDIKAVIKAVEAGGREVRFIGGCVRDALLRKKINDIDLATPEHPDRVIAHLENAGLKVIPTGINYGTVTAVSGNHAYQITTLRRDIKTDGRHAEIEFTMDWEEDAKRRDFTFNAISATPRGKVYDYVSGLKDLADGRIQFIGDPEERILEDHLRILRFFRFIAVLGLSDYDQISLQKCVQHAHLLTKISGERIREELFKILKSESNYDAIEMMASRGVLSHFLPEAKQLNRLKHLISLEDSANISSSLKTKAIRQLASILETNTKGAHSIAKRFGFSKSQRNHLIALIEPEWRANWKTTDNELRAILYKMRPSLVIDLCLLEWSRLLIDAPHLAKEQTDAWLRIIRLANTLTSFEFPLTGRDVLDLGVNKGPRISELLQLVENWWTSSGCRANRDECQQKLKELIGKHS